MRHSLPLLARVTLLSLALTASSQAAGEDGYEPDQAGHPLRVAAYVVHPVGVLLDRLIFHPAWRIGQRPGIRDWVGADVPQDESLSGPSTNHFLQPYSEDE